MKKNYYAKALALTVAASMVSVPAFAAEETDPQAQEETVEKDEQEESEAEEQGIVTYSEEDAEEVTENTGYASEDAIAKAKATYGQETNENFWYAGADSTADAVYAYLDGDTLKIVGEGATPDYAGNGLRPWGNETETANSIINIVVGEGVTRLGERLFQGLQATNISIPSTATDISEMCIASMLNLQSIDVAEKNPSYESRDDVLFTKDGTILLKYPSQKDGTSYTVPDGVTRLGNHAFSATEKLTELVLPDTLEEIGRYVFSGNTGITSLIIPDSVTDISDYAFNVNVGIKSITIGTGIKEIQASTFNQSNIETVTFAEGSQLKEVGRNAFYECANLKTINLPATLEKIGQEAFRGCSELVSVAEDGVVFSALKELEVTNNLGKNFLNCEKLENFPIVASTPLEEVPQAFVNCKSLKAIVIPDTVKRIASSAFSGCTALENVQFGSGLETIEGSAFNGCGLKKVEIDGAIKLIQNAAFAHCPLEAVSISADSDLMIQGWSLYTDNIGEDIYLAVGSKNGKVTIGNAEQPSELMKGPKVQAVRFFGDIEFSTNLFSCNPTASSNFHTMDMTEVTGVSKVTENSILYYFGANSSYNNKGIIYVADKTSQEKVEQLNVGQNNRAHVDAITNGGTFDKDTAFTAGQLAEPQKSGYTFGGWYDNEEYTGNEVITVTASTSKEVPNLYYAKWTLDKPVINVDGTATKVYDGEDVTLSVSAEGASYKWYKVEGETRTEVGTERTLTLKNVANSGSYVCEVTADGVTETSDAVTVSITKATPALTLSSNSGTSRVNRGPVTFTYTYNGDSNKIKVASSDKSVATAEVDSATKTVTVTLKSVGTAKITVSATEGANYNAAQATYDLTVQKKKSSSSSSSDTSAPTYGVSTGKTENGEISVTPAKAEAGEKVTIKATPDSGYQLDKITVKDKNNSTVKLTKVDENEYTFTMPSGKVSVDATFARKDATDDNTAAETGKTIKLQIGSRIVNVDNEAVIYDVAPVIRNDRTLVPIRIITETLGGKVDWNGATKEVTLTLDGREIKMTIGKTLEKYGVAPVIIDGRTFVPVRFVADELGATVAWDDATKTVTIKTAR